ncbi:MAG: glycosyltransferase [bacterium]
MNKAGYRIKSAVVLRGTGIVTPYIADECVTALNQANVAAIGIEMRVTSDESELNRAKVGASGIQIQMSSEETVMDYFNKMRVCIKEIKPDFILSIDAVFTRDYPALFDELGIPVAAWFVDDPMMFMTLGSVCSKFIAFSWDRVYVKPLSDLGCLAAEYLPLGTNPAKFRRTPPSDPRCAPFACDVSFVGSSLGQRTILSGIENEYEPRMRDIMEECVSRHSEPPHPPVRELLNEALAREKTAPVVDKRRAIEVRIETASMALYRSRAINRLARFAPQVYGDSGWPALLEPGPVFRGPIGYDVDLPLLYSASRINLNLTKSQLKTSVNQRVFDAPACGGFVLTDKREDAELLFDTDKEIAVFNNEDDMATKVAYFLENNEERESRARMTKRHVLAEHTYAHRIRRMLEVVENHI